MQASGVRNVAGVAGHGVVLYQHAVRRLLEARDRVQRHVQLITKAAAKLEGDGWKSEAGVPPASGSPDLKSSSGPRTDLGALPSGEELLAALAEWREAWQTVGRAWHALTPDGQVGLKEPKELY